MGKDVKERDAKSFPGHIGYEYRPSEFSEIIYKVSKWWSILIQEYLIQEVVGEKAEKAAEGHEYGT